MSGAVGASLLALIGLTIPPPPIASGNPITSALASFEAEQARCAGSPETPLTIEPPIPVPAASTSETTLKQIGSISLRFRIDPSGRPLGIDAGPVEMVGPWVDTSDVVPAFAAWRFAPGGQRNECTVTFRITAHSVSDSKLAVLAGYLATPTGSSTIDQPGSASFLALRRIAPAKSNCFDAPGIGVRNWTYPFPFEVEERPGQITWSQLTYDVARRGWAIHVKVARSSGNAEFDRRSVAAMRSTRFFPGGRTGCTYVYGRPPTRPLPAPPAEDEASYRPEDAVCPSSGGWSSMPPLVFPEPFRQRAIEGWAIVVYDIAPWGEAGNVRVAAAEPAEAFGQEAVRIVQNASQAPSPRGASGCVQKIAFRLPRGR